MGSLAPESTTVEVVWTSKWIGEFGRGISKEGVI